MKYFAILMFALSTLLLTGCGKKVDFRNTEVSNHMIYEDGKNDPFTGLVTNVPLGVVPAPKMGELLTNIGQVTGDQSVSGMMMGAMMGALLSDGQAQSPIVCDVQFDEGRPNGSSKCHSSSSGAPLLEYEYDGGVAVGDLKIYSAKDEGKVLATAQLNDEGELDGDMTVFNASSGDRVLDGHYSAGKLDGKIARYDLQTGKLVEESTLAKGLKQGAAVEYAADGKSILKKLTYKDGKLDGQFEQYDENGKLIKQTTFVDGRDQQLEAQYRKEAQTLIEAGFPYGLDATVNHVRNDHDCVEAQLAKPNETRTEAQLKEACEVLTVEKVRQDYGSEINGANSAQGEQVAAPVEASTGSDTICKAGDGGAPALGSSYHDGIYLCREPVDEYWNDWFASSVDASGTRLEVQSEGKTSGFRGQLAVNCATGDASWADATNFDEPLAAAEISGIVPLQVIATAKQYFCKG